MFGVLLKIGETILKQTGVIGKGKMTVTGAAVAVVSATVAGMTGDNPFEAIRLIIDATEVWWTTAKPALGVISGIVIMALGYFRKAGAKGATG